MCRVLLIGLAGAALLSGAGRAVAQDMNNVAPFSNNLPYLGNVLSNTSSISNTGPGGAWTGDIVSNTGDISNTGAGAIWTGSVSNNGGVDNRDGARWVGDIVWNNNAIRNRSGSTWEGKVLSNGGANTLTLIDNRGIWVGDVVGNTTRIFNYGASWTGDIVGNTGNIYNNYADATLNPGGVNAARWNGDVLNNGFLIINFALGEWTGDVIGNPGDIANYGNWTGDLANSGRIIHTGVWTGDVVNTGTFFWAQNQIVGALDNRGRVQLTGNLSGITTLTNSGRLELTHTAGPQTLSVANAVFAPTSSYEIDVNAAGESDRIVVSGHAALAGTVRVVAATGGAPYASPTSYTILSAGSISGQFASVTTDLAFFAPHISYGATTALLTLKRNDAGFAATGATGNQVGAGESIELLGAGHPLYDAVLWLTPEQAQDAFSQLSGEAYASADSMAIQSAGLVGGVVMNRIDQAFKNLNAAGSASAYAGGMAPNAVPSANSAMWTQFYGAVGLLAAEADRSALSTAGGGVAVGLDGVLGDWRLGMMLHAGLTTSTSPALGATIGSTDYGVGLYGGGEWNDTRLALGAVYTRRDIASTRQISFPGFTDTVSGQYAAGTAQAFAELSHAFDLGAISLVPYAGLALVNHATDGFTETGGAAQVTRSGAVAGAAFTTLGLRAEQQFVVGDAMLLTASGSLGWRRAFGGAPGASLALAGGKSFEVVGTPIAGDMIVLGAGLNLDVSEATKIDLAYDGQISGSTQTHALHATWTTQF